MWPWDALKEAQQRRPEPPMPPVPRADLTAESIEWIAQHLLDTPPFFEEVDA
jgi:hypothetical protein